MEKYVANNDNKPTPSRRLHRLIVWREIDCVKQYLHRMRGTVAGICDNIKGEAIYPAY